MKNQVTSPYAGIIQIRCLDIAIALYIQWV